MDSIESLYYVNATREQLPEIKRCIDCKFHVRKFNLFGVLFGEMFSEAMFSHQCHLPSNSIQVSLISGNVMESKDIAPCATRRSHDGRCTHKAVLWAGSDKWKNKKDNLFKVLENV